MTLVKRHMLSPFKSHTKSRLRISSSQNSNENKIEISKIFNAHAYAHHRLSMAISSSNLKKKWNWSAENRRMLSSPYLLHGTETDEKWLAKMCTPKKENLPSDSNISAKVLRSEINLLFITIMVSPNCNLENSPFSFDRFIRVSKKNRKKKKIVSAIIKMRRERVKNDEVTATTTITSRQKSSKQHLSNGLAFTG